MPAVPPPLPSLDHLSTPVWIYHHDRGRIVWANRAALRLWNADTLDALTDRNLGSLLTQGTRRRLAVILEQVRTQEAVAEQWTFFPGGQPVSTHCWIRDHGTDADGRLLLIEAHLAAPELSAQENRATEALRHAAVLVLVLDDAGRVLYANPMARTYCTVLAEPGGDSLARLLADPAQADDIARALESGGWYHGEVMVETVDGRRWMSIDARTMIDAQSGGPATVISMLDVTDHRAVEASLLESEQALLALFQLAPVPLLITRPSDGIILLANARVSELVGLPEAPPIGRCVGDFYAEPGGREALLEAAAATGSVRNFETTLRRTDGTTFSAAISGELLTMKGDVVLCTAVIDIHAAKAAQVAMRTALEQQRALNLAHQKFVSMVSHEFRAPLTIIDGSAQRLLRDRAGDDRHSLERRVAKIRNACRRLGGLIDDTLTAGRLDENRIIYEPAPLDLTALASEIVQRHEDVSPRHRLTLTDGAAPVLGMGDRKLLDMVLTNLVSNAIKYSPDGGKVEVTVDRPNPGLVTVTVSDQGRGIPPDEVPRIFERYYRASTAEGINGTGIGLYTARRLTEMHGGTLTAWSTPGTGSRFTVNLPQRQPPGIGPADDGR